MLFSFPCLSFTDVIRSEFKLVEEDEEEDEEEEEGEEEEDEAEEGDLL